MDEHRIYVAVAGTIQVPVSVFRVDQKIVPDLKKGLRTIIQPVGRQAAQACHVVSKLRHQMLKLDIEESKMLTSDLISVVKQRSSFNPVTTIILQARDSNEMLHVHRLLFKKKLNPVIFSDTNDQYGPGEWPTAVAVLATKKQVDGILDYLPLWGTEWK